MSLPETKTTTAELIRLLDIAKDGYATMSSGTDILVVAVKVEVKLKLHNADSEISGVYCLLPYGSVKTFDTVQIDEGKFHLLMNYTGYENERSKLEEFLARLGSVLANIWPSWLKRQPVSAVGISLASLIVAPAVGELVKRDQVSLRNNQPWQAVILLITDLIKQLRIADCDDNELDELKQLYLKWHARQSGTTRRNFDGYDRMNTLARKRGWKISELEQKLHIN
jgi:hypothetical protein